MTTVFYTLTDAANRPMNRQQVRVALVAPGNPFRPDADTAVIQVATVSTDHDGRFDVDLPPMSTYEYVGARYRVDARDGMPQSADALWYIAVPDGAGPFNLRDILTDPPPAGEPIPPVGAHSLGQHTDVDLSGETSGQVLKFNGTKWVPGTDLTGGGSLAWTDITGKPTVFPSDIPSVSGLSAALTSKADAAATSTALASKADAAAVATALGLKADTTALTAGLATKANTSALAALATVVDEKADADTTTAALATKASKLVLRQAYITSGAGSPLPDTLGAWAAIPGFALSIPATIGDYVELSIHAMRNANGTALLDAAVATAAGALLRFLATGTNTPALEGDPGFYLANAFINQSAPRGFTVQAGDLEAGAVRFVMASNSAGAGVLYADSSYPFYWQAKNFGPVS